MGWAGVPGGLFSPKRVSQLSPADIRVFRDNLSAGAIGTATVGSGKFQVFLTRNLDIGRYLDGLERSASIKVVEKGCADAGKFLQRAIADAAPKPGYPGDKPGKKPLNRSIRYRVKSYVATRQSGVAFASRNLARTSKYKNGIVVLVVGGKWREGQHAHLVERGHDLVRGGRKGKGGTVIGRVPAYPFLQPTARRVRNRAINALTNRMRIERSKALAKARQSAKVVA